MHTRPGARRGVSLVEVLVALVILGVAALGSAATIGYSAHVQRRAAALREAYAALRVQAAVLMAAPCDGISSDSTRRGAVAVSWNVVPGDGFVSVALAASYGGVGAASSAEVTCP